MSEASSSAMPDPTAPVLRLVEWIASDPASGVLRVRGDFPEPARSYPTAPVLVLRDERGALTQRGSLHDERPGVAGWRAAYLVSGALLSGAREKWLEWPDGMRLPLPDVDVSVGARRASEPPPQRGAEVFDRAVLAERRAQRAESAHREQARAAEAAMAALGALERRVEELTHERDALAAATRVPTDDAAPPRVRVLAAVPDATPAPEDLTRELEAARAAQREAEEGQRRQRQALDDALGALGRLRVQAAEVRLRMRTQIASASADAVRLAVLESERRTFRSRLQELRGELDALRERIDRERALGERLAAELETRRVQLRRGDAERDALRAALEAERIARARSVRELAAVRDAATARDARIAELEDALARERASIQSGADELRRRLASLDEQLRGERSSRRSLTMQLRVARSAEGAARAEAAARAAAQTTLRRELDEALREAAGARAELAALRGSAARGSSTGSVTDGEGRLHGSGAPASPEPPVRRLSELEAELLGTRRALEAARERLRRAAEAADDADASDADAPRRTLDPALAERLRRRVAEFQASAADSTAAPVEPAAGASSAAQAADDVGARLEAAAATLRASTPSAAAADPGPEQLEDMGAAPAAAPEWRSDSAAASSLALAVRAPAAVVVARTPASPSADARPAPSLRAALVRLASQDPFTAARLLAELLPAQGAFLHEDIDYDLTIRELGTFAVTVAQGRTSVRLIGRPRSRREAEFHLCAHALTLAELLAGRPRRVGRLLAPVKVRGSRRGLEVLAALAQARPSLSAVARAGAALDPGLLVRVLPHLIDPLDTDGHSFTVAHEIVDGSTQTWYVRVDGRRGVRVSTTPPAGKPDARVTMSRATFDRLVRDEPLDSRHKPWVRGDFVAVETLRRWIDHARR